MMRRSIVAGLFATLAGCPRAVPPQTVTVTGPPVEVRCPDPRNCTVSNGTGVYFAEGGAAGMGSQNMMITHFINTGSSVQFQGRYFDINTNHWRTLPTPGQVSAEYPPAAPTPGARFDVVSVSETGTVPTWALRDPNASRPVVMKVSGDQLRDLTLIVDFTAPPFSSEFALTFDGAPIDHHDQPPRAVTSFPMRWTPTIDHLFPASYCQGAIPAGSTEGPADSVVFQQGIDVDPITGWVTRDATTAGFVTLSCYRGAPATVYRWRYDHMSANSADNFYFDAGIQMKRASYCANADYWTASGTEIQKADDRINRDLPIRRLEAWWSPQGALCLNPDNERHPELKFPGSCPGRTLPACPQPPTGASTQRFLVDGPLGGP